MKVKVVASPFMDKTYVRVKITYTDEEEELAKALHEELMLSYLRPVGHHDHTIKCTALINTKDPKQAIEEVKSTLEYLYMNAKAKLAATKTVEFELGGSEGA